MTPLSCFPIPKHWFTNLHIDLVGPLPPSGGCSYLLTIVDQFTIWLKAIHLVDATAETVTQAFISNWVSCFGVPMLITAAGAQLARGAVRRREKNSRDGATKTGPGPTS